MKHIDFARQFLGLKEQNGELPNITQWANEMKVKGVNASYAWCAIFLNYVLFRTGYESMIQDNGGAKQGLNVASSRDFWKVGKLLSSPKVGCIVVFSRGNPNAYKGHVGIVSEVISESQIKVISGNDSNAVTERIYTVPNTNRLTLIGYRELSNNHLAVTPPPSNDNLTRKIIGFSLIGCSFLALGVIAYKALENDAKSGLYPKIRTPYS